MRALFLLLFQLNAFIENRSHELRLADVAVLVRVNYFEEFVEDGTQAAQGILLSFLKEILRCSVFCLTSSIIKFLV